MVGMSREDVLACMGPPLQKATEGTVEVWRYATGSGQQALFSATNGNAIGASFNRYCIINIAFRGAGVSSLSYSGPSGPPVGPYAECALAVKECVR